MHVNTYTQSETEIGEGETEEREKAPKQPQNKNKSGMREEPNRQKGLSGPCEANVVGFVSSWGIQGETNRRLSAVPVSCLAEQRFTEDIRGKVHSSKRLILT